MGDVTASLLFLRNPDGLKHHMLHCFFANEHFQERAKLQRSVFQKCHHFSEILWRERFPICLDSYAVEISEAPFQR